ncbi:hypothetical protein ACFLWS_03985 [Chloroflexota bacterium]
MTGERKTDMDTAKKLLDSLCPFLEHDPTGRADFKITDGVEAALLSAYTKANYPGAYFIANEKYHLHFCPSEFTRSEPVCLERFTDDGPPTKVVPILANGLSSYFAKFPALYSPKYLMMVDGSLYCSKKGKFYPQLAQKDIYEKLMASDANVSDYLIWVSGPDGNYAEDLWEYISALVLRDKGYLVSYNMPGGGDLCAYSIPDIMAELRNRGLINGGVFLEQLELLPSTAGGTPARSSPGYYEIVCIEAESTDYRTGRRHKNSGVLQVEGYMQGKSSYTHAFVAGPYTAELDLEPLDNKDFAKFVGLISCDEHGESVFVKKEAYREASEESTNRVRAIVKLALAKNLTFEKRCQLLKQYPSNPFEYRYGMLNLDMELLLDTIVNENKASGV